LFMISDPKFPVEPWCLRETEFSMDVLAQTESVFALANGHIGWRATLEEGEPHALPGCYLNGVYELRPLPYAEAGYGYPESGQTVINVTNGKVIRLLVDDEPFDVRYGELRLHERQLDFRAGTLGRQVEWTSPAGQAIRVRSVRMVSLTQRAVAAMCYEVEPLDRPARVVVQSELVTNEQLPAQSGDPRAAAALEAPLSAEAHYAVDTRVHLIHRTRRSGLRVAAAMDHLIDGPASLTVLSESGTDLGRTSVSALLEPGQRLRIIKYVTYSWSAMRSVPAMRDQVDAALTAVRQTGWEALLAEQRCYLDAFWDRADVEVDGDTQIQQAVRFALFHLLQAGARAERQPIAAKGLTGPGYDGHAFWDTETFVLPVLTYTVPNAAADALRWRHATLRLAVQRARQLGLGGATFPWRTIHGEECSGYWPAGTAAFHINADIADAVVRYADATGDHTFERDIGLELLTHTARLWRSLGHHDDHGLFRIDGVTGPDEYSAIANNNVYTNLMAQQNLRAAADLAERHPTHARALGIDAEEMASWRDAAETMFVPYDDDLGVHPQAEGFTKYQMWDFASTTEQQYPLLLHFPYFQLYRKQVVKQADLVLAMQFRGDAFTDAQKARNFAYYEQITVRDSSLSACTQAIIAAEVGHLELAHDYLSEAALMDLDDLEHNTRDGLHMASLAGSWLALVAGLGGMRRRHGTLSFAPRLPEDITRLAFTICIKSQRLRVELTSTETRYVLTDNTDGATLPIIHHGQPATLSSTKPLVLPLPPPPATGPEPTQPPGRAPARRRPHVT
jgi:alpha,alpha-trehalose phosphorylase